MKSILLIVIASIVVFSLTTSCSNKENSNLILSTQEKEDLLYMFEEEKLARDTYKYLDGLWSVNQFANIKNSEQSHMNALESLLIKYTVPYSKLEEGHFTNQHLQDLYNQFVIDGQVDLKNALKVGATIEDLDIVDLKDRINLTTKSDIISAYQKLQCGSRNHLRSFVSAITNQGSTYTPQFLSVVEFNNIINASHEQCN